MSKKILIVFPMPSYFNLMDRDLRGILNPVPPIGTMYVAAALERRGYDVRLWDQGASTGAELDGFLNDFGPDLVGFGCCTVGYDNALEIASRIRAADPQVPIVFGGPHTTGTMEQTLAEPCIDYVVAGEAEEVMGELADHLLLGRGRLEDIQSLGYLDGDSVRLTPRAPQIRDLDALPFPAWHMIHVDRYDLPGIILSARGCPFNCNFCAAGPLSFRQYRPRGTESFVAEIRYLHDSFGLSHFFFADDLFTAIKRRAIGLCDAILELPFPITWTCESRVDTINAELLSKMAEAGCTTIQFGVESGNDGVLKAIRKNTTRNQICEAVRMAVDAGIKVAASIIIGHHADTEETIRDTVVLAAKLRAMAARPGQVRTEFSIATPLPGTDLFLEAGNLGIEIQHTKWRQYNFITPVMNTAHLTAEEIRNLYFEANMSRMCDITARKNREAPAREAVPADLAVAS